MNKVSFYRYLFLNDMKKKIVLSLILVFSLLFNLSGCSTLDESYIQSVEIDKIPEYSGNPYVIINDNVPNFEDLDQDESFQTLNPLDELNRTRFAYACLGKDLMPTKKRGDISSIHPSGWHSIHDDNIQGGSLYNRCHLIGYQLSGTDDERNLITGTRYLNVEGMLPFENMVADYIKETENHVLYRVTPVYTQDNLVADGVFMEAYSVEDQGKGICFFVYCYNVQPEVEINYSTGEASIDAEINDEVTNYVLNINSKKIHLPECTGVQTMKDKNKKNVSSTLKSLLEQGYTKCNICLN